MFNHCLEAQKFVKCYFRIIHFSFVENIEIPFLACTDEKITCNEPIEPEKGTSDIRPTPYSLPDGFHWDSLNLDEPLVLKELYMLLNENYVEDDDSMFRFDYPPEFLKW